MDEKEKREYVEKNAWKVRDCDDYLIEYKECKSMNARFNQYYIFGEFIDCSKWKEDYKNCKKCGRKKDFQALYSIISHENERIEKRVKSHLENDVWKKRDKPFAEWNSELPDWRNERQKNSFPDLDNENDEKQCIIF